MVTIMQKPETIASLPLSAYNKRVLFVLLRCRFNPNSFIGSLLCAVRKQLGNLGSCPSVYFTQPDCCHRAPMAAVTRDVAGLDFEAFGS